MTQPTPDTAPRAPRPQVVMEVVATQRINPHMVRLTFGGEGFKDFTDRPVTDKYIKLLFADPSLGLTPPYDIDAIRRDHGPEAVPVRRTYTVRKVDHQNGTIDVDFVVHGEDGLAGPWAAQAQPGDVVCFNGPGGNYKPEESVDWHLLAGDESALPAIATALEAMPSNAEGVAFIEVQDADDEIELAKPSAVEIRWVHRKAEFTPTTTKLAAEVMKYPWRSGLVQVFAHGEREMIKSLRRYLADDRGIDRRMMSLSAYWAYGRAEDTFQAEKREPIGKIFPDA